MASPLLDSTRSKAALHESSGSQKNANPNFCALKKSLKVKKVEVQKKFRAQRGRITWKMAARGGGIGWTVPTSQNGVEGTKLYSVVFQIGIDRNGNIQINSQINLILSSVIFYV